MKTLNRIAAVGFAMGLLAQPGVAFAQSKPVLLDGRVIGEGINWKGGSRGSLNYFAKIINAGGKVAVCGAIAKSGRVPKSVNNRALRDISVYIDDLRLVADISYFAPAGKPEDVSRSTVTACRGTDIAWRKEFETGKLRFTSRGRARFRH